VTQREKETPAARREEAVCACIGNIGELHAPTQLSFVHSLTRSLARSLLLSHAHAWHSLAGFCLPPPFFPPRVPYEGPAESQSTAQCPFGLRTPRAGRTKDETHLEKVSMRVAPHFYLSHHSHSRFPSLVVAPRDEGRNSAIKNLARSASSNCAPRSVIEK